MTGPAPTATEVASDRDRPWLQMADRATLERYQLARLRAGLERARQGNDFLRRKLDSLDGFDIASLTDLEALAALPYTTKRELVEDQRVHPPFGSNHTFPRDGYIHLHQTSGTTGRPLAVLDTAESWDWWAACWEAVYHAAGVSRSDTIFLAFSFGPFIGFWSAYVGARRIGALVVPGGGQTTSQRLATIQATGATVLVCTPTYALRLAEVAREEGIDLARSAVRTTIHAGEPGASIPSVRARIEDAWGARAYDHLGMTEMGAYGFTCLEQRSVHVNEAEFIAEILDPATGKPVPEGLQGELVLTNLGRWGYPALRYRTGDRVVRGPAACACGRTMLTLPGGVLGRVDDMVVVRGVNIYPSSVEAALREFPDVDEFRIIVTRAGEMDEVAVEVECPEARVPDVERGLRSALNLRVPVTVAPAGSLPRFELKARRLDDRRSAGVGGRDGRDG